MAAGQSHRLRAASGERDWFKFKSPTRIAKKCAKSGKPALEYCVTAARIEKLIYQRGKATAKSA